ncbi:MAG: NAD-dependent epimerase/dehydratase family protein [Pseudomonadota bacterium]
MTVIVITGAAGFIGAATATSLLAQAAGDVRIIGVDDLNPYYPVALKEARLARLLPHSNFRFERLDISDHDAFADLLNECQPDVVIHLAAQAGVRYSLKSPFAYARSNLVGHLSVLEACRSLTKTPRLVYASSSSVYGEKTGGAFSENDRVDGPVSLYAATKRADELMSATYAHLYGLEQIGLRFFTVYGPWGRPDMAYWTFTEKMLAATPIPVFHHGKARRDFTYVDDIVAGVIACATKPPNFDGDRPHKIYNIGNNSPVELLDFIKTLEDVLGVTATLEMQPAQPGDVTETFADTSALEADYGYAPNTPLRDGLTQFAAWFKDYKGGTLAA